MWSAKSGAEFFGWIDFSAALIYPPTRTKKPSGERWYKMELIFAFVVIGLIGVVTVSIWRREMRKQYYLPITLGKVKRRLEAGVKWAEPEKKIDQVESPHGIIHLKDGGYIVI